MLKKFFAVICLTGCLCSYAYSSDLHQLKQGLKLRGIGIKRLLMMRVFVAGLYLDEQIPSQQALNDVAKRLEVIFYAHITGQEFTRFTISCMRANATPDEFKKIQDRFNVMGQLFPNIKPGDILALVYEPGKGTTFMLNGWPKGTIAGADFGKAIFATWIGPKPFDYGIKKQVLGLT